MSGVVTQSRGAAKSAGSASGIVVMSMLVAGVILYHRSSRYTTTQNVGHATGLLVTTVALTFVADIGGGTIAAGLAVLIVLAVAYKAKPGALQAGQKTIEGQAGSSTVPSTAPAATAPALKKLF